VLRFTRQLPTDRAQNAGGPICRVRANASGGVG
jgi:hypothetical protein